MRGKTLPARLGLAASAALALAVSASTSTAASAGDVPAPTEVGGEWCAVDLEQAHKTASCFTTEAELRSHIEA
ncbi:hypothetical protein [Streptomyces sp. GESEQ-4]|uniref:hypothetical protein n=1 Tax=Streptomyces sp. GESEQ-4 TaxID=2812655 RepID=UPI001B329EDA|nr:hypothetical protein [Streptomyces sp. GESEQ-4]